MEKYLLATIDTYEEEIHNKLQKIRYKYNGKNKIVWQHKGYVEGDEMELFKEIKKLVK